MINNRTFARPDHPNLAELQEMSQNTRLFRAQGRKPMASMIGSPWYLIILPRYSTVGAPYGKVYAWYLSSDDVSRICHPRIRRSVRRAGTDRMHGPIKSFRAMWNEKKGNGGGSRRGWSVVGLIRKREGKGTSGSGECG